MFMKKWFELIDAVLIQSTFVRECHFDRDAAVGKFSARVEIPCRASISTPRSQS